MNNILQTTAHNNNKLACSYLFGEKMKYNRIKDNNNNRQKIHK